MKKKLLHKVLSIILFCTVAITVNAQTPTITITNLDTIAIQGMPAQPVLKISIDAGSANNLSLEKLVIKSLCQDSTDIDSVAIFYTSTFNRFSFADYANDAPALLAKRQKFHHDSTVFTGFGFTLDPGISYFWVVLDLAKTSKAAHYLNATTRAEGITISGIKYPATAPPAPAKQILIWQKYFTENFETANADKTPKGWSTKYYGIPVNWEIHQGGYGIPDDPGNGNPGNAKSGKTNARFAKATSAWRVGMLNHVQPIDLTLATKPLLVFYQAQMYNVISGNQDSLGVFYQALPDTAWKYMKGYQLTTPVGQWVKRQIVLPDVMSGKKVNIGFKGYANYGWGVCVDSVMIYETQSATRIVNAFDVVQARTDFTPQSSTNNPILRTNIRIKGNTGTIKLNSYTVTSGNTSDIDVASVKLYHTNDSAFITPTLISTGSFSSGKAAFTGLNATLETGDNYFWITYDIAANANPDDILDASIEANDIVTSAGTFPSSAESPSGKRIVKQTIFWDDFETDKGWGIKGDFQRATPQGKKGTLGFPDPSKAYSGSMVLGTDLTNDGLYANSLTYATADTATSPLIPAKYFKNVQFYFARWLNVEGPDSASIDIKYAGDSNWKTIWNNNRQSILESNWDLDTMLNSKILFDRKNFRIRYRLGPTDGAYQFTGWNIDNVFFTGDSVKWDAAVTNYLNPQSSCGLTSNEHFSVTVKNTGPKTLTNIPIKFSIDGGKNWVSEIIPGPLAIDNSTNYTFTTAANLSNPKIYNVIIKVAFNGDNYPNNDSVIYPLTSVPTYSAPYHTGFEQDTTFWTPSGLNSSWALAEPSGDYINTAYEGNKSWKTDWSGYFLQYENSYLQSPCFNFSNDSLPVIDFRSSYVTEPKKDGTKMEYSLDGGSTWTYLPTGIDSYPWIWYTDTIHAFHALKGWTGRSQDMGTQIWERDRRIVREVAKKTNVRFRFNFKADSTTVVRSDGFAFDDFKIMNAPFDIGVTAINNLVDGANYCQYEKNGIVQVTVKNHGIRNMHANDTIILGVKVDNQATVVDTFKLTSSLDANGTLNFTMKKPVNIIAVGSHKIKAFTMIEKEPNYYSSTQNDADSININVKQNPITNLPDTVYSASPDTVHIKTYQGTNYAYSWEYGGSTVSTTYSVDVKNGATVRIGNFHLSVTDNTPGNSCVTKDTVYFKLLKSDVGISKILAPITNCGYGTNFKPQVRIKNYGTDTLRANQVLPIKTRLTKGGVIGSFVDDNYTLTSKLAPKDSMVVTLNNTIDLSVADNYTFMVKTALSNDIEYANDSTVNSFQIYGYPTIDLGPDIYKKQLSYTIKAPAGYSSYLWNDNTTNDSLVVTTSGKYKVTATNANGCQTSDSVNIMLSIHDLAIKRVISPLTFCTKPGMSTISCKLMNNGSDTIKTSETIVMSYALNGGTPVTQNFSLGGNLNPNDSTTFTFVQQEDIHTPSTYNFLIKANVASDLRRANDSVLNVVKVFNNPSIELGQDQIIHALSYKVAPGNNYASYLWQDNSTDSTYVITQTHKNSVDNTYSVTVTDVNGCKGNDAVHVYFYVDDLKIDSVGIPATACSQAFPVKVKVLNSGSESYINKDLVIRYQVNSDPEVMEAFKFTGNPNDHSVFTFATPVTPNKTGYNKIKATIEMIGDLRRDNDTLTKAYNGMNGPTIDFGATNDILNVDLPYTLDAGSGTNYNYSWSTSATTQTISVSTDGLYAVTVTDGSCTASKSVTVVNNIYDLSVSGFTVAGNYLPLTACKFGKKQAAFIEIQNSGNVSLTGQPITVQYQINGGSPVSKSETFTGAKLEKVLYFIDSLDLSQAAISTFDISLTYAQDKVSSNNSITKLLNILTNPAISFAGAVNDTIKAGSLPITLNPGNGAGYTYAWYDGATTPTISTSNTFRWHTVTVSNGYCSSTDSVWVKNAVPVFQINGTTATITVYPNPVSDVLNVELSVPAGEDATYEFFSNAGAILKTGKLSSKTTNAQTINVESMPKGLYYLRIYRKDWSVIEKVVIQ